MQDLKLHSNHELLTWAAHCAIQGLKPTCDTYTKAVADELKLRFVHNTNELEAMFVEYVHTAQEAAA